MDESANVAVAVVFGGTTMTVLMVQSAFMMVTGGRLSVDASEGD